MNGRKTPHPAHEYTTAECIGIVALAGGCTAIVYALMVLIGMGVL